MVNHYKTVFKRFRRFIKSRATYSISETADRSMTHLCMVTSPIPWSQFSCLNDFTFSITFTWLRRWIVPAWSILKALFPLPSIR